jgi:hypothetical protein
MEEIFDISFIVTVCFPTDLYISPVPRSKLKLSATSDIQDDTKSLWTINSHPDSRSVPSRRTRSSHWIDFTGRCHSPGNGCQLGDRRNCPDTRSTVSPFDSLRECFRGRPATIESHVKVSSSSCDESYFRACNWPSSGGIGEGDSVYHK